MKNKNTLTWLFVTSLALPVVSTLAAEGGQNWWEVRNRVRVEYDDNIYESAQDASDSFKLIEEVEFHGNIQLQQSFIGIRYRPSFTYWTDRDPDDTDLHHDLDLVLNHRFTPNTRMGFKNTFRIAEQPELIENGAQIRANDDYTMNTTDLNAEHSFTRNVFGRIGGRYKILEYDRAELAETDNYDIWSAGVSGGMRIKPETTLSGEYRYEQTSYDNTGDLDRDSSSQYVGLNLEQTFSPTLLGSLRAGYQNKSFDADEISDESSPYFDAKLTMVASKATRISAGIGYSMFEADVYPFTSQDRTLASLSVAHDITARVALYVTGSYQLSEYSGNQSLDQTASDGEEEILQASARLAYMINRSNWIELGYQYLDLSSDFREEFDRNRVSIGWRTNL